VLNRLTAVSITAPGPATTIAVDATITGPASSVAIATTVTGLATSIAVAPLAGITAPVTAPVAIPFRRTRLPHQPLKRTLIQPRLLKRPRPSTVRKH
jgi:hypothetical protein